MSTPSLTYTSSNPSVSSPSRIVDTEEFLPWERHFEDWLAHSVACEENVHHDEHLRLSEPGRHTDEHSVYGFDALRDDAIGPQEAEDFRLFMEMHQAGGSSSAKGSGELNSHGLRSLDPDVFDQFDVQAAAFSAGFASNPAQMPNVMGEFDTPTSSAVQMIDEHSAVPFNENHSGEGPQKKRKIERIPSKPSIDKTPAFPCKKCKATCRRKKDLERHNNDVHQEGTIFACGSGNCLYRNRRGDKMKEHCRRVHKVGSGAERYTCWVG